MLQSFAIKEEDGKFCLYDDDDKKLGCHDTEEEAKAAEREAKAEDKKAAAESAITEIEDALGLDLTALRETRSASSTKLWTTTGLGRAGSSTSYATC